MYSVDVLRIGDVTVEDLTEPVGIDAEEPCFSWKLLSDRENTDQASYRIRVWQGGSIAADTGMVESDRSVGVVIPGFRTRPMSAYEVEIEVRDAFGRTALARSSFETGRLGVPFKSGWVEPEQLPTPSTMDGERAGLTAKAQDRSDFRPAQCVRIPFTAEKPVSSARVYATAHGVYELSVNGVRPDSRVLAPEHTPYGSILLYQTYDITHLVEVGENVVGVVVGDGWWAGRIGTTGDSCQYGDTLGLLLDVEIEYTDGSRGFASAEQGCSHTGPIIYSDLFVGERYDARLEMPGWDRPGFDASSWRPVRRAAGGGAALIGQDFPPVRPEAVFRPERIFRTPAGDIIVDAGQELAGFIELELNAPAGCSITLEYGEMLDESGELAHTILNENKDQTDVYITRGGAQRYRPHFTYHGFRYVRVSGWPGEPTIENFLVVPLSSAVAATGSFSTDDIRINQLESNIEWSQRSNTVSIPTDCPSREKAGWTGDVLVYAPTMCSLADMRTFLRSWLRSCRAEQLESGAVPMVVPYLKAYRTFLKEQLGSDTSCGWGDAIIAVPLALYRAYGNRRVLEENYSAMRAWLEYIEGRAQKCHPAGYESWDEERRWRDRYLWNTDFHFGDWLIPSIVLGNSDASAMNETAEKTMGVVGPAYFAWTAQTMAGVAGILGESEDEARFLELARNIRRAFIAEYVHADGTMDADFQGIYVLALAFDLVPDGLRAAMAAHLVELIKRNGDRLDTGFLSVPLILDVLCDNGYRDLAWRLLFQEACPSWLYEVSRGATTVWESWGAVAEDGTVSSYSYNHYAFGCVGDWMYRHLGGLVALEPGYKRFLVAPALDCGLGEVRVSRETPYGRIEVHWRIVGDQAFVEVAVPCNTSARIELPGVEPVEVGSGSHAFAVEAGTRPDACKYLRAFA